jgi:ribose/xylose/arabinose/galactoside ABC-type transport system permease subunit
VLLVRYGVHFIPTAIACLAPGTLIAAQGYWVAYFKIPSFIVTPTGIQAAGACRAARPVGQSDLAELFRSSHPASFRNCFQMPAGKGWRSCPGRPSRARLQVAKARLFPQENIG